MTEKDGERDNDKKTGGGGEREKIGGRELRQREIQNAIFLVLNMAYRALLKG